MRLSRGLGALFVLSLLNACGGAGDGTDPMTGDAAVDSTPADTTPPPDTADTAPIPDTAADTDDGATDAPPPQPCSRDEDCMGGDFCTNARKCVSNKCAVVGGVPACDDGIACTTDGCDSVAGACTHTVDDRACPTGKFCDPKSNCVDVLPCLGDGDTVCERLNDDACKGTFLCNATSLKCERGPAPSCLAPDACTPTTCTGTPTKYTCGVGVGPDYTSDVSNCGGCGKVCPPRTNATAVCASSACAWGCNAGWVDLNGDVSVPLGTASNGCECQKVSAIDKPDLGFVDENCDGIDGDVTKAIFVSLSGNDTTGDGTMKKPFATIAHAISVASTAGKDVYVDKGVYAIGTLSLKSGVSIYGGYDSTKGWSRAAANETRFNGGSTAIVGTALNADLELQLLHVVASAASTPGTSSYAVNLSNSSTITVSIVGCVVEAGAGGAGKDAPATPKGADGSPASGRIGGASTCGAAGGDGGVAVSGATSGNPGNTGATASVSGSGAGGGPGAGGHAGKCLSTTYSTDGTAGLGASSGSSGSDASPLATALGGFTSAIYVPASGQSGTAGSPGGGGGGGGSGGGDSSVCGIKCCDSTSGDGGGGGAGGCGGPGGAGGGGGGGSFPVLALSVHVKIDKSQLNAAAGGRGGNGGVGGLPGAPGSYAAGQAGSGNAKAGGPGGPGASGGSGGAGAGGAGGPSICVAFTGGASYQPTISNSPCARAAASKGGTGGTTSLAGPGGITSDLQGF
jgi:hypothetical protein